MAPGHFIYKFSERKRGERMGFTFTLYEALVEYLGTPGTHARGRF